MTDTPAERRAKRAWEQREREKDPEGFKKRQLEAQKRYYEKNSEKVRAKRVENYRNNLDAEHAKQRKDYQENTEKRRAAAKKWKLENADKIAEYRKDANLKRYGITYAGKQELFASQGNRCAACGSEDPRGKNGWHVDHCHKTNKVRGTLCLYCNVALGKVQDDTDHLRKLITYLEKHNAKD